VLNEPEVVKVTEDPWVKKFLIAAVACFVLVVVLFVTFKITLGSSAAEVRASAADAKI
jgi:hypothetical protein